MSTDRLYTVKEASEGARVSQQSIYTYTSRYKAHFSPHASPPKGQTRLFTGDDIRLLAFIRSKTTTGNMPHDTLLSSFDDLRGELDTFVDYSLPDEVQTTALMDPATIQAMQALLQDARQREQGAVARVDSLQRELADLRQQLGVAQGKIEVLSRPWWKKLLGLE